MRARHSADVDRAPSRGNREGRVVVSLDAALILGVAEVRGSNRLLAPSLREVPCPLPSEVFVDIS